MVVGFRRTVSFPAPKTIPLHRPRSAAAAAAAKAAYRARSASLPSRFHPLLVHLDDETASLRSWALSLSPHSPRPPSVSWLSQGLAQLALLLSSLSDLLHHPHALDPLRPHSHSTSSSSSAWADPVLDALLRLADAHASFRAALLSLNHLQSDTRAALRRLRQRRDPARLASALRAQRRADRALSRLASAARAVARARAPAALLASADPARAALAAALWDAAAAAASASAAVFSGVAALSSASTAPVAGPGWAPWAPCPLVSPASFSAPRSASSSAAAASSSSSSTSAAAATGKAGSQKWVWWVADLLRWRWRAKRRTAKKKHVEAEGDDDDDEEEEEEEEVGEDEKERRAALKRLEELEECIKVAEPSTEKVFRSLVNARVSLLNILTPSF